MALQLMFVFQLDDADKRRFIYVSLFFAFISAITNLMILLYGNTSNLSQEDHKKLKEKFKPIDENDDDLDSSLSDDSFNDSDESRENLEAAMSIFSGIDKDSVINTSSNSLSRYTDNNSLNDEASATLGLNHAHIYDAENNRF